MENVLTTQLNDTMKGLTNNNLSTESIKYLRNVYKTNHVAGNVKQINNLYISRMALLLHQIIIMIFARNMK